MKKVFFCFIDNLDLLIFNFEIFGFLKGIIYYLNVVFY